MDDFTDSMAHVVELWNLAEFYQLEGLKLHCMGALERVLQEAEKLTFPCDELKIRGCVMGYWNVISRSSEVFLQKNIY